MSKAEKRSDAKLALLVEQGVALVSDKGFLEGLRFLHRAGVRSQIRTRVVLGAKQSRRVSDHH